MFLLFESRCSACGATTGWARTDYSAVYLDEPAPVYAHPDDPHLVVLARPGLSSILAKFGYSHMSVMWAGRLVSIARVFCRNCGQPFEIRRLTADLGAFGCIGGFALLAGAAGAGVIVGQYLGGWIGYMAGLATMYMLYLGAAKSAVVQFVRWRYSNRAARVATPRMCPTCGSRDCVRPTGMRSGTIPCRACGQRAVRFRTAKP